MILIIGGYAQGQLNYVRQRYGMEDTDIYNACLPPLPEMQEILTKSIVINSLNDWLVQELSYAHDPMEKLNQVIHCYSNCILISDEVGNGIVPIDQRERICREAIGQVQVQLAQRADEVIRVICGIGQKIK